MNNDVGNKNIVPELRFPEFANEDNWTLMPISHKVDLISGFPFKSGELSEDKNGTPILRGVNITEGYIRHDKKIDRYFLGDISSFEKYILKENDLVIGMDGSKVGKNSSLISSDDKGAILIQRVARLRSKSESTIRFIYHHIHSPIFHSYVDRINTSSGIPHISAKQINEFEIGFPYEVREQEKIAGCLTSIDNLISNHSKKLESLNSYKKGLMQQLFPSEGETVPKYRFPEYRNSRSWQKIEFIDVADKDVKWSFIGGPFGSNLKSSDYVHSGVRIIQLQNIGDGQFLDEYKIYTSNKKADELLSNNIYPGDIILSKMGDPVGRACLIPSYHDRYVMCSDGIRLVVDEKKYSKYFIYSLINSAPFRSLIEKSSTGSTRKRIGLDNLKKLPMFVPTVRDEQQKIADCLVAIDDQISAQTKKLEYLKDHKKGLLQKLFPSFKEEN